MGASRQQTAGALAARRVGGSGLSVTEIGFGTGTLGGLFSPVSDDQARATVSEALRLGVGYIDTAPYYGLGRSEHAVGDVLRGATGVVLSTKVGRVLEPYWGNEAERDGWVSPHAFSPRYDYSYDGIMRSVADSRQRLGLSQIDMLFVHDIGKMTHGDGNAAYWRQLADGGYRALSELKAAGAVKAIGLGVNEWEILVDALDMGEWDVFLLAQRYTLLEQPALAPLLHRCVERKTSVVIGGVFNGGLLVGGGRWNYRPAPDEVLSRLKLLAGFCDQRGVPLPAAAIQMPLAHPAVCSVLAGGTTPQEVSQFLDWYRLAIPAEFWRDLALSGLLRSGTPLPGGLIAH